MAGVSANRYLSRAEMEINAKIIFLYFAPIGWSTQAVAAMLGNMESESTINPGIYEDLDDESTTNGFGLVQWTPNTKLIEWARDLGLPYEDIVTQCKRIEYELANGIQWIPTDAYPMTFAEFSKSTADVGTLANAFLYNYERPASLDQPNRATQAASWYSFLTSIGGGTVTPTPTPASRKSMSRIAFLYAASRRKVR